ncbi:energy transducer TonB [Parasphingorhabdus sp.]|uniref:energy transducer TonB n=1 Tax=Parasphingorhabdus sp. TaxID=2709688 RepID=UPI003266F021
MTSRKAFSFVTALSLTFASGSASAFMPVAFDVENLPPKKETNLSRECAKALANKKRFLSRVARLKYPDPLVHDYLDGLNHGRYGCPKNPEFAYQILDRHVGDPIRINVYADDYRRLLASDGEALTQQRVKDLGGTLFARTRSGANAVPKHWTIAGLEKLLLANSNWKLAAEIFRKDKNYVRNKLRDDLLIKNLIDPASPIYNLVEAVELVSDSSRFGYRTRVAEQLADRNRNAADVRTAFKLMHWYSPFVHQEVSESEVDAARSIFEKLVRLMAESNDPDLQARSKAIQQTGNPHAQVGGQAPPVDPYDGNSATVISWPEQFGAVQTIRSPNSYSSRAISERVGGRVELAALFNPDGTYGGMAITASSGRPDLDRATKREFERYNQLKSKTLLGYEGQYVKIPMPIVEWHLLNEMAAGETGVFESDGITKVYESRVTPLIQY